MFAIIFIFLLLSMFVPKIICWNCRGISSRDISNQIQRFIRHDKPHLLCLVETRADSSRVDHFAIKLPRNWKWAAILAYGYSRGIIVIWNNRVGQVSPIAISRRALHLIISPDQTHNWLVSVIYNGTRLSSQISLWSELSKLSSFNFPWLIIGDFDSITSPHEHKGGSYRHYSRKAGLFLSFIDNNDLLNLHFTGPNFTWCNNRTSSARRWARFDRCLVNLAWYSIFNSYALTHFPRLFSDHAPLLLAIHTNMPRKPGLFRFDNFWLEYLGCHNAVREVLIVFRMVMLCTLLPIFCPVLRLISRPGVLMG